MLKKSTLFVLLISPLLLMVNGCFSSRANWKHSIPDHAEHLYLPNLFTDGCVLQRGIEIPVFGWDRPFTPLSVTLDGETFRTVSDSSGFWEVDIPSMEAGGPYTLYIEGSTSAVVRDVMIGEVWLASGQSNMEWPLFASEDGQEYIDNSANDQIRLFKVSRTKEYDPVKTVQGYWQKSSPKTTKWYSAIAWHYGRLMHEEYGVAVGLIDATWGGSRIEPWIPESSLLKDDLFAELVIENDEHMLPRREMEKRIANYLEDAEEYREQYAPGRKENRGSRPAWAQPDLDESLWERIKVPGSWDQQDVKIDGVVWYRRSVEIPEDWEDEDLLLSLARIDDFDEAYFNGVKVGQVLEEYRESWSILRRYRIPSNLVRPGKNTIAVRVVDVYMNGGIFGLNNKVYLSLFNEKPETERIPLHGYWKMRIASRMPDSLPPAPVKPDEPFNHHQSPGRLYNGMIAPVTNYGVRGILWYQGESNVANADQYERLFQLLVEGWREAWDRPELPFIYAQISACGEKFNPEISMWSRLREAQLEASRSIPHTAMVQTLDHGDCDNVHPSAKLPVAERMFAAAEQIIFGKEVVYSGPLYRSYEIDDSSVVISFEHVHGGLTKSPNPLRGFHIAGEDRIFYPAKAVISGDKVHVSHPRIQDPAAVRYAWADCPEATLFNKEGLPASSFRTDDWDEAVMIEDQRREAAESSKEETEKE